LSTIYANVVIGAEKKGSLDDESLRRLLSAAREFQIQGSYKPASTKQVRPLPNNTSAVQFSGPFAAPSRIMKN